ncbi:Structure-specific endonuclease subunit SLX4, partial [Stegodyphus mimosarum]
MHDSCSAVCVQSNSQSFNKTFAEDTFPTEIEEHSTCVSYYQNNSQRQTVTVQSSLFVTDLCKSLNECSRTLSPNLEVSIIKDMHKSFDEFTDLQQQSLGNKNDDSITASSVTDCLFTLKANVSDFHVDNFKSVCRSPNKFTSSNKSKEDISSPEILISDSDEELPAVLLSDSDEDIPVLLDSTKIIENKSMSDADQVTVNRSVSEYSPYKDSSTHNFSHISDSSNKIELRNDLSPGILICSSDEDGASDEVKGTVPFTETAGKASCKSDNTDQLFIRRSQVCYDVNNDELNGKQQICLDVGSNELVERNQANDEFSKKKENSFLLNNVKSNERNWIYFDSNETHEKAQICVDSEDHELNEENSICHSSGKKKGKELPNDLDLSTDDSFLPLSERIRALTKKDSLQDFQAPSKQNKVSEIDTRISNLKSRKSSIVKKSSGKRTQQKKCNENSHCEKKENYYNDEMNGKQQICLDIGSSELVERNQADEFNEKNENSFVLNDGKSNERNWTCHESNERDEKVQICIESENHEWNEENSLCHSSDKEKEKELPSYLDLSSDDSFLPLSQRVHTQTKEDSFQDFQAPSKQNKVAETDTHISNLKSRKSSAVKKLSEKKTQQKKRNEISHCEKKENYSTPVVQDKRIPQFKLSDSPITPLPDYKNMVTPDIKQALKNIGVRALPRRKAIALLSRVYDETHPWAEENCGGDVASSHEKHQNRKHRLKMKTISEDPSRSLSNSSSQEDVLNNPSNSRFNDVLHICSSQLNDDNQPASKEDMKLLKEYILSNQELYNKILNYVPINMNDLHEQLKENGIKINNKKLMDYLDEQCIVFTYPRTEEYRKKQQIRSQRFRKRKIAKLSQQGP